MCGVYGNALYKLLYSWRGRDVKTFHVELTEKEISYLKWAIAYLQQDVAIYKVRIAVEMYDELDRKLEEAVKGNSE